MKGLINIMLSFIQQAFIPGRLVIKYANAKTVSHVTFVQSCMLF